VFIFEISSIAGWKWLLRIRKAGVRLIKDKNGYRDSEVSLSNEAAIKLGTQPDVLEKTPQPTQNRWVVLLCYWRIQTRQE
jgi:hypothetical protein